MTESAQPAAASAPAPITVASAVAANQPISLGAGVAALRNSRAQTGDTGARPDAARTDARRPNVNPVSDAARTLGNRGREARQERQAEQSRNAENAPQGEVQDAPDDLAQSGETRDELTTANGEPPDLTEGQAEGEPGEAQTIDLGDGVAVTLDEVRDGFMMKADHTRKTQALAVDRQAFDADRTQRVGLLDQMLTAAKQMLPDFKPVHVLMREMGGEAGLMEFGRQQELLNQVGALEQARQQEQAHHSKQLRDGAIKTLAEKHGDKAAARYDSAVDIAHQTLGMPKDYLSAMMAHPEIVELVHDAAEMRALRAKSGTIKRTIALVPKVTRPGARVSQQAAGQQSVQRAHDKLKSSGNLADAVSLLRTLRKGRAG